MASPAAQDVLELLQTVREERSSALGDVMPALREYLNADRGLAFTLEGDGSFLRIAELHASRIPVARVRRDFDALLAESPTNWAAYNPVRPEPAQRNRALSVMSFLGWDRLAALPAHRMVMVPSGMGNEDQLRVLVCDGGSLLSWVGVLRTEPFSPAEVRQLQALVPALNRRLCLERDLRTAGVAHVALAAALEHLSVPAWVVSATGVVRHANAPARDLHDLDRAGVASQLSELVKSGGTADNEVTRLTAPGLPPHFLIIARAANRDGASQVAFAAARWGLTPRQTAVLQEVILGRSNKAIAASFGCSPKAIEFHLTTIYARAGVDGRASLAARVFAQARAQVGSLPAAHGVPPSQSSSGRRQRQPRQ